MRDGSDLQAAASVLAVATAGLATPEVDPAALRVSVAAPGGHTLLVRVLAELDARSVPVTEASLRRPTLDDVFLQLTGGSALPENRKSDSKEGVPA